MKIRKFILWIAGLSAAIVMAIAGLAVYVFSRESMTQLVFNADIDGYIPLVQKWTQFYLWNFRGSPEDLRELEFNGGAGLLLERMVGEPPKLISLTERELLIKHLMTKGLNINSKAGMNGYGLTPLHSMVIGRQEPEAMLLLRLGARTDIKDDRYKLTALELAQHLQQTSKFPADFKRMEELLKQNSK
jgi:hypothetical protein